MSNYLHSIQIISGIISNGEILQGIHTGGQEDIGSMQTLCHFQEGTRALEGGHLAGENAVGRDRACAKDYRRERISLVKGIQIHRATWPGLGVQLEKQGWSICHRQLSPSALNFKTVRVWNSDHQLHLNKDIIV